jgi:hypothetical protein
MFLSPCVVGAVLVRTGQSVTFHAQYEVKVYECVRIKSRTVRTKQ